MSAVSCELFQMSSAWISGESSSPNEAWIPPCAFAELHDWSDPLVASATRAPARSADTPAASPDAPLPITSTSKNAAAAIRRKIPEPLMRRIRSANTQNVAGSTSVTISSTMITASETR